MCFAFLVLQPPCRIEIPRAYEARKVCACDRRDVAQPGRALAWGARGRQFKSARPDHFFFVANQLLQSAQHGSAAGREYPNSKAQPRSGCALKACEGRCSGPRHAPVLRVLGWSSTAAVQICPSRPFVSFLVFRCSFHVVIFCVYLPAAVYSLQFTVCSQKNRRGRERPHDSQRDADVTPTAASP